MPRFAVLFHQTGPKLGRPSHWDLLLEEGPTLMAWALSEEPAAGQRIEAMALPAHRKQFLDYEGPLSAHRGSVRRWDGGTFLWLERNAQLVRLQLSGAKLSGEATLVPREFRGPGETGAATPAPQFWDFTFSSA